VSDDDVSLGQAGDSNIKPIWAHSSTSVPGLGRTMKGEQVVRVSGSTKGDKWRPTPRKAANATSDVPRQNCLVDSPFRLIVECGKDGLRIKPSSEPSGLRRIQSFGASVDVPRRRLLPVPSAATQKPRPDPGETRSCDSPSRA
jgi:hypothetical protein